ncbi:MAG TPA: hypothetical protein PLD90_15480 [Rhodocyclaceae bacterium]|nr:hypothetical protein [Rhodocyclaceae bacterium]HNC80014.1 hypothetical protein [Rhodocyclaceae bacterium]
MNAGRGRKMTHAGHLINPVYSLEAVSAARGAFHSVALEVKDPLTDLYGEDSDQVAAIGLKKKSDRKRPSTSTKPPAH